MTAAVSPIALTRDDLLRVSAPLVMVTAPLPVLTLSPRRVRVPAPVLVRVPVMVRTLRGSLTRPMVRLVSVSIVPPLAPMVMPRRLSSMRTAVVWVRRVPPLRVSWPAFKLAGLLPRPVSAAMATVPPLMVVAPVKVLTPERVRVPALFLVRVPVPVVMVPVMVVLPAPLTVRFWLVPERELAAPTVRVPVEFWLMMRASLRVRPVLMVWAPEPATLIWALPALTFMTIRFAPDRV